MARPETAYASALLSAVGGAEEAERCERLFAEYAAAFAEDEELRGFLLNPALPKAAKKDLLARLAPETAPEKGLHCLYLMVDKGRIGLLPETAAEYRLQRAALTDTLIIRVHSALPLALEEEARLKEQFARRYGSKGAVVETVIDPSLIGGMRVQVGDMVYDQSLLGGLNELRRVLADQMTGKQ